MHAFAPLSRPASLGLAAAPRGWPHLRRMLLWWLLVSLPLHGLAGIVDQLRGASHVHTAPTVQPAGIPALLDMTGWRHSHGGAREPAAVGADHHHSAPDRHDHPPGDATVVAVDEPDSDTPPASRGKRLLLDLDTPPVPGLASGVADRPVRADSGPGLGAADPACGRLERPPRA